MPRVHREANVYTAFILPDAAAAVVAVSEIEAKTLPSFDWMLKTTSGFGVNHATGSP